jgi:hypothetical protein
VRSENRHSIMAQGGDFLHANWCGLSVSDVLGLRDSLRTRDFDRNGLIEIIVKCEKDFSEPALPKPTEDVVTPDLGRMQVRERDFRLVTIGSSVLG